MIRALLWEAHSPILHRPDWSRGGEGIASRPSLDLVQILHARLHIPDQQFVLRQFLRKRIFIANAIQCLANFRIWHSQQ